MADLICPHCGMPNPSEQNVCSFCRQPLHVAEDKSIRPGDTPTKKTTAELEPVLPEWLREARAKARRAEAEKAAEEAEVEPPAPKEEVPDFLAGLESASREEQDDEIPEWMRGAAPISAPAKTPVKPEPQEQPYPRRQEIHWGDETEDELGGMATLPVPSAPESGDAILPWMQATEKESKEEKDDVSSWLAGKAAAPKEQKPVSPFSTGSFAPPSTGELTDWLEGATSETAEPVEPVSAEKDGSLSDWLSNLPRDAVPSTAIDSSETFGEDISLPDWMKSATGTPAKPESPAGIESPFESLIEAPLPDWMKPSKEPPPPVPVEPVAEKEEPPPLNWMAVFDEEGSSAEPAAPLTESVAEVPHAPAFVAGEEPQVSHQADELFAIEMPDWLSNITPTEQKSATAESQEPIAPADLPSWVQAMRPVETVLPGSSDLQPVAEGEMEESGPLAGLRGVLPGAGELFQPGKPKAQALRLQASAEQQGEANLLEQMLAAETQAEPIRGGGSLATQRILRWVISAVIVLLVAIFLLAGSQSIPLPAALPEESSSILPVMEFLPEGAPVLMVFDYEPALAGELETAAAPFVDRLFGLRHPRVTILSTSPTGAALAERFLARTQSRHNYQLEQDYINLGYLPGGTAGILSFAENPRAALPLPAWNNPAAQDVTRFSDYAAVILLTDQAETARAWVEQTTAHLGGRPLLVVSSAQAAPMIQPYLLSGQVNGLVSGLHGGAAFESSEGPGSPVRGYWDAYNFAILFAALMIVLGGLWNLFAGARARRQGLDEV